MLDIEEAQWAGSTARAYYVTVRDDTGRTGWLLGPYDAKQAAQINVARAIDLAHRHNERAWFYAYGVASVPRGLAHFVRPVFT